MMRYEEIDPMVAAEVFGADFLEMLEIAGITPEEFYEDFTNKEDWKPSGTGEKNKKNKKPIDKSKSKCYNNYRR